MRRVHHANLSSFHPSLQGVDLTLDCGIPQRHDNGKKKTSYQLIDAMHDKNQLRGSLDKTASHNH